jgi:hypothetical protein
MKYLKYNEESHLWDQIDKTTYTEVVRNEHIKRHERGPDDCLYITTNSGLYVAIPEASVFEEGATILAIRGTK